MLVLFFFTKFEVEVFLWHGRQSREVEGRIDPHLTSPPSSPPPPTRIIFETTKNTFFNIKVFFLKMKVPLFNNKNQLLLTSCALFNSWPFKVNLRLTALFYYSPFENIGFYIQWPDLKKCFYQLAYKILLIHLWLYFDEIPNTSYHFIIFKF